jgi:hypothetical protein
MGPHRNSGKLSTRPLVIGIDVLLLIKSWTAFTSGLKKMWASSLLFFYLCIFNLGPKGISGKPIFSNYTLAEGCQMQYTMEYMKKTILYRLFKVGGIPKTLRSVIESEEIVVCDEGIGGWMLMKDFRAPGKRFKRRMDNFVGFLVITQKRILSHLYGKPILDILLDDPKVSAIQTELTNPNQLELSFESSLIQENWSGRITLRYNTPKAKEFYGILSKIVQTGHHLDKHTA